MWLQKPTAHDSCLALHGCHSQPENPFFSGEMAASGADIYLRSATVEDTVRLLLEVCDRMNGAIQPQCFLHKHSIRCASWS
jgi:hypothetical protein